MSSPANRPLPTPSDIELIVSDVDGTLLDSHHALPTTNPTYIVLRRIREAHPTLPIVLSTGKQFRSTLPLRALLDLSPFHACHLNGNVLYAPDESASGTVLKESGLDVEVVQAVYAALRERGTSLFLYDQATVYQVLRGAADADGGEWARRLRGYGETVVECEGDEGERMMERVRSGEMRVIKMAVCEDEAALRDTRAQLASFPPANFALTQALTFCCELIPASHNKGTMLSALLTEYLPHVRRECVLAFGDGENDLSMFGVAGMSVAMGNAMPSAQAAATWQTATNDEGGVGLFLEKIFFPEG